MELILTYDEHPDTTNLQWRALFNALPLSPFLFTTWVGAPIVERVLRDSTWRWGYGSSPPILTQAGQKTP